jgi:hypothetical protein
MALSQNRVGPLDHLRVGVGADLQHLIVVGEWTGARAGDCILQVRSGTRRLFSIKASTAAVDVTVPQSAMHNPRLAAPGSYHAAVENLAGDDDP